MSKIGGNGGGNRMAGGGSNKPDAGGNKNDSKNKPDTNKPDKSKNDGTGYCPKTLYKG